MKIKTIFGGTVVALSFLGSLVFAGSDGGTPVWSQVPPGTCSFEPGIKVTLVSAKTYLNGVETKGMFLGAEGVYGAFPCNDFNGTYDLVAVVPAGKVFKSWQVVNSKGGGVNVGSTVNAKTTMKGFYTSTVSPTNPATAAITAILGIAPAPSPSTTSW